MTDQPDFHDPANWDRIDGSRCVDLDDVGSPGYSAVVVLAASGDERFVLACREALNQPEHLYWPADWRQRAPHELTGRLPRPYAPTCRRRTTSNGKPCKVRVQTWGDTCSRHGEIESERIQPV